MSEIVVGANNIYNIVSDIVVSADVVVIDDN